MERVSAAEVLRKAEGDVARLATQAATRRDYDTAEMLLGIARSLAATAGRLSSPASAPPAPPARGRVEQDGEGEGGDAADDAPVFERDGEELVKTGQSKNDGKTYEHKAPRRAVDILVRAIQEKANKNGEFRTSRILPLSDEGGKKLPGYQGYLCLRWLRHIGLVDRVGRQRYQLRAGRDLVSSVETAWHSLHQR